MKIKKKKKEVGETVTDRTVNSEHVTEKMAGKWAFLSCFFFNFILIYAYWRFYLILQCFFFLHSIFVSISSLSESFLHFFASFLKMFVVFNIRFSLSWVSYQFLYADYSSMLAAHETKQEEFLLLALPFSLSSSSFIVFLFFILSNFFS